MKTPVIIPAFNEERRLERTLHYLPDSVAPIIAINGSDDLSNYLTAAIAEQFGAEVQIIPEQGKLPAIQKVLRGLGDRALEPLLILDADTRPLFPKHWHSHMLHDLSTEGVPQVVGGPVWFTGRPIGESAIRSVWRAGRALASAHDTSLERVGQCGPNMGIKLEKNHVLKAILDLEHTWPGEDIALTQAVIDNGGDFHQPVHPFACTTTPTSLSFVSLSQRLRIGRDESRKIISERYAARGAPGSKPYSVSPVKATTLK